MNNRIFDASLILSHSASGLVSFNDYSVLYRRCKVVFDEGEIANMDPSFQTRCLRSGETELLLSFLPSSHFSRPLLSKSTDRNMATEGSPCMVCGKPSTLRCSQCLKVGHQDFWFCSREHQKLVSAFLPPTVALQMLTQ